MMGSLSRGSSAMAALCSSDKLILSGSETREMLDCVNNGSSLPPVWTHLDLLTANGNNMTSVRSGKCKHTHVRTHTRTLLQTGR